MKHDLLHIEGKPYILIPLHEYRMMMTDGTAENANNLPETLLDRLFSGEETPVKILRHHRGLTQKELADKAGLSRPYLTEIEQGRKDGSVRAVRAIADALDVDVKYLMVG